MRSRKNGNASLDRKRRIKSIRTSGLHPRYSVLFDAVPKRFLLEACELLVEEVYHDGAEHKAGEYGEEARDTLGRKVTQVTVCHCVSLAFCAFNFHISQYTVKL